jgi:hypothetical protein
MERASKLIRGLGLPSDTISVEELACAAWAQAGNLEKHLGPGVVDDLEFRIVPRRREPQRAEQSVPALLDEAENIADPVLRDIYKASRLKAQA